LMNVTIRQVKKDSDTALPYAKEDVFGFVMLFTVERSAKGAASLEDRARRMSEEALKLGGCLYLPYRNYATAGQLMRAYPEFPAFVKEKQAIDPTYLFTNGFFDYYAQALDYPVE
jgi:FAD/FMN-containing dehydrogenase